MITLQDIILEGRTQFEAITDTPSLDTELLVCHVLGINKIDIIMEPKRQLTEQEVSQIREVVGKRLQGWPVQYLVGTEGFMGLLFEVTPSVLIPRPDTELLVEKILELLDNNKSLCILDIGTGSGAISISLAHYFRQALVDTVDISKEAIEVACRNAKLNQVSDRIKFLNGDLFEPVSDKEKYDVIVSNPPYIPTADIETLQVEVRSFEPRLALDGGQDGYDFYRRIVNESPEYLKENGILAFETGHDQAKSIAEFMRESDKFTDIEIFKDLNQIERVVIGYKRDVK